MEASCSDEGEVDDSYVGTEGVHTRGRRGKPREKVRWDSPDFSALHLQLEDPGRAETAASSSTG